MRNELIEFLDGIREYVRESNTNIAYDERASSEFVDIYLKTKGEKLPKHLVIYCDCEIPKPIDPYNEDKNKCKDCNGVISCR